MFKRWFLKKKEVISEKKEPEKKKYDFLGHVHTKNMGVHKIVGYYECAEDLATKLSHLLDTYDSFATHTVNGDVIVIKSKDVEFIRVESKPYED